MPVGIRFTDHLHFGPPAPARSVIIPLDFILGDFAQNFETNLVTHGNLIRFAAMLCAHLNDEIAGQYGIASRFYLFQHVAHGLFDVGIFAGFGGHLQNRRMRMLGSGDQHGIHILQGQQLLGMLERTRGFAVMLLIDGNGAL